MYTNWHAGQPSNTGGSEECIASSTGYGGTWNDIPCNAMRPVVCERNF